MSAHTGISEPAVPPTDPFAEPPRPSSRRPWIIAAAAGLALLHALVVVQLVRPAPDPRLRLVTTASTTIPGSAPQLPWPTSGQAVLDVDGIGRMGASGAATPTPTASVAKVMTAYVFLRDHPLRSGEEGPTYRISPEEAARLEWRKEREETHVDVVANQPFTEREALEALLLVSANNIAHELARWGAGGDAQFAARMNATARRLGMTRTTYTDPSGFDATTVSTAADQARLMSAAMKIPAFAEIVARRSFTPRTGGETRLGGNSLLGIAGVVGGKTGFTSQAGANYVFAARSHGRLIVGAVMAQTGGLSPALAIEAARPLIEAAESSFTTVRVAVKGAVVAQVDDGLGNRTPLVATDQVTATGWPGSTVRLRVEGRPPTHAPRGRPVGSITDGGNRTGLRLSRPLSEPSPLDRLLRLA